MCCVSRRCWGAGSFTGYESTGALRAPAARFGRCLLRQHAVTVCPSANRVVWIWPQAVGERAVDQPQGAPPYAGKHGGEISNYDGIPPNGDVDDKTARQLIHGYYASMSFTDAQLGRVLDELDCLDLSKNTIIVLWGDHGWHLGDHGMWTKHTNYEQANHIPLLMVAPGVAKPGTTRQMTETVDIFPTLTELAGLPKPAVPQPIDGLSLVPVLKDPSLSLRDHVYHCFPRGEDRLGRAIRTERYRMVEWKKPGAPPETADIELYDYQAAMPESENLAGKLPDVVKELRAILARHPEAQPKPLAMRKTP